MSVWRHLAAALTIRLLCVVYGDYQDGWIGAVPYTDVDYHVFTDAAAFVCRGDSPYRRATYRYSPLLAWLLAPGCRWPGFGKTLFCTCDVLVGLLLSALVRAGGHGSRPALTAGALWWYNPLPVGVCSRGNAEPLVLLLVLCTLYLATRRRPLQAGLLLGAAVHLKLYPVVLAPALYWSLHPGAATSRGCRYWMWPNRARTRLVLAAAISFTALSAVCWTFYGDEFIQQTYLHHLLRRDARHNFSVFFYLLYATEEFGHWSLSLVSFVPQLLLVLLVAVRFHRSETLVFCAFLQIYMFVTFNKVCTSQYLLWYLSLLPAVLPNLSVGPWEGAALLLLWYLAQACWLLPAYLLEFRGMPVFRLVWFESVAFFCANVGIMSRLIRKYQFKNHHAGRSPIE